MWVLTNSQMRSHFISLLNILNNYLTPKPSHTLYIMPRLHRSFCGKIGRTGVSLPPVKMKGMECLWDRGLQGALLGKGKLHSLSWMRMTDSMQFFSAASLLLHMSEHTISQHRRQEAGHIQLIILICLASGPSHFPTDSAETPREGGIGTKIIMELWDPSNHH